MPSWVALKAVVILNAKRKIEKWLKYITLKEILKGIKSDYMKQGLIDLLEISTIVHTDKEYIKRVLKNDRAAYVAVAIGGIKLNDFGSIIFGINAYFKQRLLNTK